MTLELVWYFVFYIFCESGIKQNDNNAVTDLSP
jgi:hypothetical protein